MCLKLGVGMVKGMVEWRWGNRSVGNGDWCVGNENGVCWE